MKKHFKKLKDNTLCSFNNVIPCHGSKTHLPFLQGKCPRRPFDNSLQKLFAYRPNDRVLIISMYIILYIHKIY